MTVIATGFGGRARRRRVEPTRELAGATAGGDATARRRDCAERPDVEIDIPSFLKD